MEEDDLFENEMAMDSVESNAVEDMDEDSYSDPNAGTVHFYREVSYLC